MTSVNNQSPHKTDGRRNLKRSISSNSLYQIETEKNKLTESKERRWTNEILNVYKTNYYPSTLSNILSHIKETLLRTL